MLIKTAFKIILIFMVSFCMSLASAEVMLVQPVSVVLKQLKMQGYLAVSKIELIGDEYSIKALANDGKGANIRVNSHTGEITSMVKTDPYMSMSEAVEKLEAVGYSNFSLIEAQGNSYIVIAISPNGAKTKLVVNALTGGIQVSH